MIARDIDSFILGEDPYPEWFKKLSEEGKVEYLSTNPLIIQIKGDRLVKAKKGDVLMSLRNSAVVVPEAAAKEYMTP